MKLKIESILYTMMFGVFYLMITVYSDLFVIVTLAYILYTHGMTLNSVHTPSHVHTCTHYTLYSKNYFQSSF